MLYICFRRFKLNIDSITDYIRDYSFLLLVKFYKKLTFRIRGVRFFVKFCEHTK